jgi:hypothetical protein
MYANALITGTVNFEEGTVLVLDFETRLAEILKTPSPDLADAAIEELSCDEKEIYILSR